MSVADNIAKIQERLLKACEHSGRDPKEIIIMGVSKFVPEEKIKEAFNCGIRYFGESRVQESSQKFAMQTESVSLKEELLGESGDFRLHFIGSLQRNKVKTALQIFDCIQSVDRVELIEELVKQTCRPKDSAQESAGIRSTDIRPMEILLELHTGEETKNGFENLDTLFKAAELAAGSSCLKPMGLMTMAPFTTDEALIRSSFRQLVKAQQELQKRFPLKENWACLSMGMSNDFEIAIEEGSTLLRIGSAIFTE